MATDKEKLEGLLKEFGVDFEVHPLMQGEEVAIPHELAGTETSFVFSREGKFLEMSAGEL